jgi:hypothetical protein
MSRSIFFSCEQHQQRVNTIFIVYPQLSVSIIGKSINKSSNVPKKIGTLIAMDGAVENKNFNEINDLRPDASAAKSLIYKEI